MKPITYIRLLLLHNNQSLATFSPSHSCVTRRRKTMTIQIIYDVIFWLYIHLSLHLGNVSHFVSSNNVWTLYVKIVQACEIFQNHDLTRHEFKIGIYKLQWLVNIQPFNLDNYLVWILNAFSVRSIFGNLRPYIKWASYKLWSFYIQF